MKKLALCAVFSILLTGCVTQNNEHEYEHRSVSLESNYNTKVFFL